MASSSVEGMVMDTSLAMGGRRYLKNQSSISWSLTSIWHKLRCLRHSWIWSVICVAVVLRKLVRILTPTSWRMGHLKKVIKVFTIDSKEALELAGWSMYHLVATLVRVHWNNLSIMESLVIFLEDVPLFPKWESRFYHQSEPKLLNRKAPEQTIYPSSLNGIWFLL